MRINRLLIPAVASVCVLTAACGGDGSASSDEGGTVRMGVLKGAMVGLVEHVAVKEGFLEDEGVESELVEFATGPDFVAALAGGSVDAGTAGFPVMWPALNSGECAKYFIATERSHYNIIARPDVEMPNIDKGFPEAVQDLEGKTIGIPARGSAVELWASKVLEDAGMDPAKDVTFVAVGTGTTALAAFENGELDALVSYPPVEQLIGDDAQMVADLVGGNPDTLESVMQAGVAGGCDWIEANPEQAAATCRGVTKAYEWLKEPENASRVAEIIAEMMDIDADLAADIWERYATTYPGPELSEDLWNQQADTLPAAAGDQIPDYATYVVNDCDV